MQGLTLRSDTRTRRRLGARLGFALGLLLAVLLAVSVPARGEPGGIVAGQVTAEEGRGLAGATVYVFVEDGEQPIAETATDEDGGFSVEVAEPRPVDVRAGYVWKERGDDGRTTWHTRTAEALGVVPGGEALRLVTQEDAHDFTVRVRVSSADGRVSGASVRAVPTLWPPDGVWRWTAYHTNDIGRVDLDGLPRLPVELRVQRKPPWCPIRGPVVLPDSLGIPLRRLEVERERVLEGRLVDERGVGIAACGVMVRSARDAPSRSWGDVSGTDGRFRVGVPESWDDATLLVGCEEPTETSAHLLAVPIECGTEEEIEVRMKRPSGDEVLEAEGAGDDASREVMEAVVREHYVEEGQELLVLKPELGGLDHVRDVQTYLKEGVDESTVRDLGEKADAAADVPAAFDVGVPLVRIAGAWWGHLMEVHGSMNRGIWRHFYDRFPRSGGRLILSPVAFSEDGRQAVIHVVSIRGRLNADGHWHLLEKRDGRWQVVQRVMTWVS